MNFVITKNSVLTYQKIVFDDRVPLNNHQILKDFIESVISFGFPNSATRTPNTIVQKFTVIASCCKKHCSAFSTSITDAVYEPLHAISIHNA